MSKREIDSALSAAYPLSRTTIQELPLDAADHELLAKIMAEPQEARETVASEATPATPQRPRLVRRSASLAAAGAFAAAIILAVFGAGGGSPGSPTPAYGAEQLRLAKISPHILLDPSNWRVAVTDTVKALEGWTEFQHGEELRQDPPPEQVAKFRWHSKSACFKTKTRPPPYWPPSVLTHRPSVPPIRSRPRFAAASGGCRAASATTGRGPPRCSPTRRGCRSATRHGMRGRSR